MLGAALFAALILYLFMLPPLVLIICFIQFLFSRSGDVHR